MQEAAGSSLMQGATAFLTMMSALSTAVQQLVEHAIKKRFDWLDVGLDKEKLKTATEAEKKTMLTHDANRSSVVHALTFALGGALSWSVGLDPLKQLGLADKGVLANALAAGVLVSFGSSFFDEALGAIREFKKAQETMRSK